ncbi:MAG: thermonuclease family protein [Candidatus Aminicenantia bacterium]
MKKFCPSIIFLFALSLIIYMNIYSQKFLAHDPDVYLYLPRGNYLRTLSMGNPSFMGDLLMARVLTYFGKHYYQRGYKYEWLYHLFDVLTDIDPYNKESYLIGGRLLTNVDVNLSNKLLEKGMKNHPDYWKIPELIGFNYFYHLKKPEKAAKYYEIASQLPAHPPYIPSLAGKFYSEIGMFEEALKVLRNFYETTEDKRLKEDFGEEIEELEQKIRERKGKVSARVIKVLDGDTYILQILGKEEKVRLVGVDAPEIDEKREKVRVMGLFSRDFARFYLENKDVYILIDETVRDKYGRLLIYLWLPNMTFFNEFIIEEGFANVYSRFPNPYQKRLVEAERLARERNKGLWGFGKEIPFPPQDAIYLLGKLSAIKFKVKKVFYRMQVVYLQSSSDWRNSFNAVIFREDLGRFKKDLREYEGKEVIVRGFIKMYREHPEIIIYSPIQIEE